MIRLADWRDLPLLHRYRNQGLFLDSTQVLTRGPLLVPAGALLSYLAPTLGIFTCLSDEAAELPLLGQVNHSTGAPAAHLTYLAPENALDLMGVAALVDFMNQQVGVRGAFRLLADVDESLSAFEILHRAGFAIYARQRIWQLTGEPEGEISPRPWRSCSERDVFGVRTLYANLVPGLVQQVEPAPGGRLRGFVYYEGNELVGYMELKYGSQGIWAQPFLHPDAKNVTACLIELLRRLPFRQSRPMYICVRSYQAWLELAMEELGAQPGPRQAVLVKHLALARRAEQSYALPAIEGTRAEPTVPFAPISIDRGSQGDPTK